MQTTPGSPACPVDCRSLNKMYRSEFLRKNKAQALKDVTFSIASGEVCGIIGQNGAGKSTTLKILMGFIKADSGTAFLGGVEAGRPESRQHVGYLPEHPTLYPNLSVYEHLLLSCRLSSRGEENIEQIIDLVELSAVKDKPLRQFSKGMVQRAGLAYALVHEPEILVLDEPMSGLDPLGRKLVLDIISSRKEKGTTILFSSHVLTDVERVCDRIMILHKGELLSSVAPGEIPPAPQQEGSYQSPLESYFLRQIGVSTKGEI